MNVPPTYTASLQPIQTIVVVEQSVVINGQALSLESSQLVPYVNVMYQIINLIAYPERLRYSVNGISASVELNTDSNGSFSYTFTPEAWQVGTVLFGATHPAYSTFVTQIETNVIDLVLSSNVVELTTTTGELFNLSYLNKKLQCYPI